MLNKNSNNNKDNDKELSVEESEVINETLDASEGVDIETAPEELPENYRNVKQLHLPQEAIDAYAEKGWELLWVRIYDKNMQLDLKNIQMYENDMVTFVPRSEVPGLSKAMSSYFGNEVAEGSHGLYVVGDLALAKWPKTRKKQREEYVNNRTLSRSRAVINDLRKNNVLPNAERGEGWDTVREQPKPREDVNFGGA